MGPIPTGSARTTEAARVAPLCSLFTYPAWGNAALHHAAPGILIPCFCTAPSRRTGCR
jgi:hypothetical protein